MKLIRDGIQKAKKEIGALRYDIKGYRLLPRLFRVPDERPHGTKDERSKTAKTEVSRGRGKPNPSTSCCEVHDGHTQADQRAQCRLLFGASALRPWLF